MSQFEIPEPNYDDPKELYAFFGLTFYYAQVLEQGVLNLAVALQAKGLGNITWGEITNLFESHNRATFGRILRIAKDLIHLTDSQIEDIEEGLKLRNHLAHAFFVKNAVKSLSVNGQKEMIDELIESLKMLIKVDREFDLLWRAEWSNLGVTQEFLDKAVEDIKIEASNI